jgi:hypothetical protein
MEKEFVTYEQSLALKELGFDEPCFGFYELGNIDIYYDTILQRQNHKFRNNTQLNFYGDLTEKISAPIFSQAFRWFREKHDLPSEVRFVANLEVYDYRITKIGIEYTNSFYEGVKPVSAFNTYEEAESACIDKLIEIIKKK